MKLAVENRVLDQIKANLFYFGLLTLSTVVVWIGVSIYAAYTNKKPDPKISGLIKPIVPVLDETQFKKLEVRTAPPEPFVIISLKKTDSNTTAPVNLDPYNYVPPVKK